MTTKPGRRGRDAPSALPYRVMPGYRAAVELFEGVRIMARRIGPESQGLDRALVERGIRIVLAAGEGGARTEPWRRALQYQYAWFGTYDLAHLLDRARDERRVHPDATLGIDALLRMAQQALTIAAGTMMERAEKEAERAGERGRRRRRGKR